ncbi:MAG TPA: hypothetical protein VJK52_03475 [Candidatus Nanoarchaeia archaeon]|nr:hypothetical protein [Candidatus Nanoarchaeia archaeon]
MRLLFGLLLTLLFIPLVQGVGVGPGTITFDYAPGTVETIDMIAINTINTTSTFTISSTVPYITCTPGMVTVDPSASVPFKCTVSIPQLDLPPGVHQIGRIQVSELPSETAGVIGGLAAVVSIVRVKIPNVGKHLSLSLSIPNTPAGSNVEGTLTAANAGTDPLPEMEAVVAVFSKDRVLRVPPIAIRIAPLEPEQSQQYAVRLATAELSSGEYLATAEVSYAEKKAKQEIPFKVGEVRIAMKNLTAEPVPFGGVAKFQLETDSFWGETIDYQIELRVLQSGIAMGTVEIRDQINPWQNRFTPIFWETGSTGLGTYDAEVVLKYADRVDRMIFPKVLSIISPPPVVSESIVVPKKFPLERLLLAGIVVLLIIVLIILIQVLRRRGPPERSTNAPQQSQ